MPMLPQEWLVVSPIRSKFSQRSVNALSGAHVGSPTGAGAGIFTALSLIHCQENVTRPRPGCLTRTPSARELQMKVADATNGLDLKAPLPMLEGVSPSYVWLPAGPWKTVLAFLEARFPDVETATWISRMSKGEVVDAHGVHLNPDSSYRRGTCIFYYRELEGEFPIPFAENIIYQDDHILVADKPHFLPVIPSGRFLHETLLVRLKKKTGLEHLTPIHRIDRETAGVVIFSHNPQTRGDYQVLFQKREVNKVYEALAGSLAGVRFPFTYRSYMVEGKPFFRMEETEGKSNSETHIDILESRGKVSLYQLRPLTGKKHQLRVHLAALGIPIVNDAFYPDVQPCKGDDISLPLQLLARAISFQDPLTGRSHYFESERELSWPNLDSSVRCA
jgi:tRNA pseudouridine32 synthase/23S rRNA pseudouridine746 synthase